MQEMRPTNTLSVFNSLVGSVGEFYLCESVNNIPMDPRQFEKCLFVSDFGADGIKGSFVVNKGSEGPLKFDA